LSDRDTRILEMLADGMTDKEIGPAVGLKARSVTRVLDEIFVRLNVKTRFQAGVLYGQIRDC